MIYEFVVRLLIMAGRAQLAAGNRHAQVSVPGGFGGQRRCAMFPVAGRASYRRFAAPGEQLDLIAIRLSIIVAVKEQGIGALSVRLVKIRGNVQAERITDVYRVMGSNMGIDRAEIGGTRSRAGHMTGTAIDVLRMAARGKQLQ